MLMRVILLATVETRSLVQRFTSECKVFQYCPMYGITDLTKLAIFTLQYACALIGALIALQLGVLAGGDQISTSVQTPAASERHEAWGPGRSYRQSKRT